MLVKHPQLEKKKYLSWDKGGSVCGVHVMCVIVCVWVVGQGRQGQVKP